MKSKKLKKAATMAAVAFTLILTLISQVFAETGGTTGTTSGSTSSGGTTDGWVQMAPMATARWAFQTEVVNNKIYAIGGRNNSGYLSSIEEYDPESNMWITKTPMSVARSVFGEASVNGKIYVIGGYNGSTLNTVEAYNPISNSWETKSPLPSPASTVKAIAINNEIYVMAGVLGNKLLKYNTDTDTWTTLAPMPTSRGAGCQIEYINSCIYVFGGFNNVTSNDTNSVEKYDIETNTWSAVASLSTAKESFRTELVEGKVYLIGGYNTKSLSSTEEYDPLSNSWSTKASMQNPRTNFESVTINGNIYVFGGENNGLRVSSAEEYDVTTGSWRTISSMNIEKYYSNSELINGTIYSIGGMSNSSPLNLVEAYQAAAPTPVQKPTLTVTPSASTVKLGSQFTTTVAIHGCTNICAEDIKLTYDTNLFEYVSATAKTGLGIQKEDSTTTPGTLRFIVSSLGKDNVATGDKDLIDLTFKAKAPGQGKVDITKGRIADNATLEMDVPDADCGEATITVETNKDVNRSGEVTLLDLGIDGWYYGMSAQDTDSTKYDADVVPDGTIDGKDLTEVTSGILSNPNYPNN